MLTQEEENQLFKAIFNGDINTENLPENVYDETFIELEGAISAAFIGRQLEKLPISIQRPAFEVAEKLTQNINLFSGVKTFHQIFEIQKQIFDSKGFKRSFNDFRRRAQDIYNIYNETWLQAEFETAVTQARTAKQWTTEIQPEKDVLPFLKYTTVGDKRVRPDHAVLDGVIKSVDDPFWNTFMPANGFRCRCTVEQVGEGAKVSRFSKAKLKTLEEGIPKLFRFNSGKTGLVFSEIDHPYFKGTGMPPRIREQFEVGRKNNFGLTPPKKLK